MSEKDNFFSENHKRLLNVATWAKYLAWVVFVSHALWSISVYFQKQAAYMYYGNLQGQYYGSFFQLLKDWPSFAFSIFAEIIGIFLKGVVYFLVLKGISLGLNMIVETDINYREKRNAQNEQ